MEVVPGLHWVDSIWDTKVYVLLDQDRVVLVDAAMPGRAGAIWRYLASLGRAPEAVAEIWLTHGDIDHMGSVAALKAASGATVVAHRADVPLVEGRAERELGPVPAAGVWQGLFNWGIHRLLHYAPIQVDRLVEDGEDLGGWRAIHVPGHTPGSLCFYEPARGIAIVGDAINHRRGKLHGPPRIVAPDVEQAWASVQKIAHLDFEVCCFGHGPPLLHGAAQRVRDLSRGSPSRGG
jgi:glyoxylase-like metal-dependent hydrolase (beta-lactamase superfamily II)